MIFSSFSSTSLFYNIKGYMYSLLCIHWVVCKCMYGVCVHMYMMYIHGYVNNLIEKIINIWTIYNKSSNNSKSKTTQNVHPSAIFIKITTRKTFRWIFSFPVFYLWDILREELLIKKIIKEQIGYRIGSTGSSEANNQYQLFCARLRKLFVFFDDWII